MRPSCGSARLPGRSTDPSHSCRRSTRIWVRLVECQPRYLLVLWRRLRAATPVCEERHQRDQCRRADDEKQRQPHQELWRMGTCPSSCCDGRLRKSEHRQDVSRDLEWAAGAFESVPTVRSERRAQNPNADADHDSPAPQTVTIGLAPEIQIQERHCPCDDNQPRKNQQVRPISQGRTRESAGLYDRCSRSPARRSCP